MTQKCDKCKQNVEELYEKNTIEHRDKWYCLECFEKKFGKRKEIIIKEDEQDLEG